MRYSIRTKLFSTLYALILLFVALSWFFNNFFLEKYYLYSKEKSLKGIYSTIESLYNGNPDVFSLELERLERLKSVNIIIFDKKLNIVYNSMQRERPKFRNQKQASIGPNPLQAMIKDRLGQLKGDRPVILKGHDNRMRSYFLNLFSRLKDDDYIYLSTAVAAIQENVKIANKFFLFTGLITMLIGGILILSITSKFTKPILELNDIARRMAVLDFSKRYRARSKDEIGNLGGSINSMSVQLEKSIKELKDANEKLKRDIERERKIDEMRKEFITNVSHELKTPIALIQGYAEGLKVNINEDEENKNYYCDVITDEAIKMNRLVMNLLDLSQLESGVIELDRSVFDISELIEIILKKNSIVLKDKEVKLDFNNNGDFKVYADYYRTEQVFVNYLNNALNHLNEEKTLQIGIQKIKDKIRVTVFNTGKHIPAKSLERVWDSFYKVEKARTRSYGGCGMGLSIVKAIQEAHKNGCGVANTDRGVVFWFELDAAAI